MDKTIVPLFLILTSFGVACRAACAVPGANDGVIQLTDWSGMVISPNYSSQSYPDLQNCTWSIRVSAGSKVKVKVDMFDLEEGVYIDRSPENEKLCYDYVTITDSDGKSLFQECGFLEDSQEVTSSDRSILIHFHSDDSGDASGFNISYTGVCEGDAPLDGLIESPNYPRPPPPGVTCAWRIGDATRAFRLLRIGQGTTSSGDGGNGGLPGQTGLPVCGRSPFKIIATNSSHVRDELCLDAPVWAYLEDITLVYESSGSVEELWAGQVSMDLTDDLSCETLCEHASTCLPETVDTRYIPNCVCLPGYQGDTCNQEIDTCLGSPCLHGTCENLPGLGRRTCICDPDFTGPDCEAPVSDECSKLACLNGGACRIDSRDQAYCVCPRDGDFTGQFCHILKGSDFCRAGMDDVGGSLVMWSDTLADDDDTKLCPGGSVGEATRHCLQDPESETGGVWSRPDLSQCVSPELLQISVDANTFFSDPMVPGSAILPEDKSKQILNITARLANATNSTSRKQSLFPGDLLISTDVMHKVADAAVGGLNVDEDKAMILTKDYTTAVDNIVDPNTEATWRNARASLVEDKVSSVVASIQKLVTGVIRNLASSKGGKSTRAPIASAQTGSEQEALLDISARNLDIQVRRLKHVKGGSNGLFDYSAGSSTISLPVYELDGSRIDTPGHAVNVYLARFQSIASLLSFQEGRYTKQDGNDSNIINSDVISAEVLSDDDVSHMRNPVELTFRLKEPILADSLEEYCVFMNMSATSYQDRWASDGCFVSSSNETHVVCHCYHLTNFAVLMDVYDNQDQLHKTHDAILSYLSYVGGGLSIVACVVAICVFQYFRLSSDRVRIHQQLAVSIVLVQVMYICVGNTGPDKGTSVWGCRVVTVLMHYSLTAMFCWMLVEGIHLYVVLVRVFKHGSHIKKYSAIGWGVPLIVVAVSVAAFRSRYGTGSLCWLDTKLLLVCFVPTVGLVLMINTVVLATVIRVMVKSNSSTNKVGTADRNTLRSGLKATLVLLPLLGLTWVLGFLAISRDHSEAMSYIFTYLFTVTNSCQGVFFLIIHCLLNVDVHQAYERRFSRRNRVSTTADTTSSRRKLSENDVFSGINGKSTVTTRSTLTDLSVALPRLSFMGHHLHGNGDKHPIIGIEESDGLSHVTSPAWHGFTTGRLPEPDYPQQQPDFTDDRFGIDNPILYSSQDATIRDNVISGLMTSRPQRNSVRFSNDSDLSL